MNPINNDAYKLLHDGALALSEIESAGMRIDVDYLDRTIDEVTKQIERGEEKLRESKVFAKWQSMYRKKASFGSRSQLGKVLDAMGYDMKERTRIGEIKTDASILESLNVPFVRNFLRVEKLKKTKNTYLTGIKRELEGEYIRPSFNLHTTKTYRSSCSSPNFQNIPVRDPEQGEIVRRCFIPREGHRLVEIDYSALEVHIAACYHRDPNMIAYLEDPERDIHRDMAAELFLCEPNQVTKDMRFYAKGQFVFAQFYGSYWAHVAPNLWDSVDKLEVGIIPMRDHLRIEGIKGLGSTDPKSPPKKNTFAAHVRDVERDFWERRFSTYAKWKENWYAAYKRLGYFDTLTGFRCQGLMSRNDTINYPVQGSAFHVLLWSLIRIVRWLRKNRMQTKVVGQIHDSIVADVHDDEFDDYVAAVEEISTEKVKQAWDWIVTPLEVEVEACGIGETWNDKKGIK